ncbi:carbohydrate ABC transporter permease [Phytoactinopolyspora halophila]|nr:carbohydrate ABC transporter permease [Phytoactinopolyspora halophila]
MRLSRRRFVATWLQIAIVVVIFLGPVLWMVTSSFKRNVDINALPPKIFFAPTLQNYVELFERFDFLRFIANSLLIAGGATLLGLVLGTPAAYAVARFGLTRTGFFMLVARMAPGTLFVIPWFALAVALGALETTPRNYALLIFIHCIITLPLAVWLLISFFEAIPTEVLEAAYVEGCTEWQVFRKVALPLARSGVAVACLMCFIFAWNYFLFSLALSQNETMPLPVIAFSFIGQGSQDWGGLMAAATMISLPALILTIIAQRGIVQGMTAGAGR